MKFHFEPVSATTKNGQYKIYAWAFDDLDLSGDCFALVDGFGWVRYSNKLGAILIPGAGWNTY